MDNMRRWRQKWMKPDDQKDVEVVVAIEFDLLVAALQDVAGCASDQMSGGCSHCARIVSEALADARARGAMP